MITNQYIEHEIESVKISQDADEPNSVSISLLNREGKRVVLKIFNTKYFLLNEMCLQNIVESIQVIDYKIIDEKQREARDILQFLLRGGKETSYILDDVVDKLIEGIRMSEYLLVEIKPIYGCNVVALAQRLEFNEALLHKSA